LAGQKLDEEVKKSSTELQELEEKYEEESIY
jgi:hypothetical protein